jgi:CheY-like chemotaxis protein
MTEIEHPDHSRPDGRIYRILVLDTPEHVDDLTTICTALGHEVVPVLTISEGMKFMDTKDHVDVIVSAAHLDNESVFDFLRQVKSSPLHRDVPFMLICSEPSEVGLFVSEVVAKAAHVLGAAKYLVMDTFNGRQLMREINALLPETTPKKDRSDVRQ